MKPRTPVFLLLFIFILAACASPETTTIGSILIKNPWVRAAQVSSTSQEEMKDMNDEASTQDQESMSMMSGINTAAFMLIENNGGEKDRLVSAQSDVAQAVEIHLSEMKDGVMSMRPVDGVEIPAGGQAELKPGGYHVMLIGIKQDLKVGEKVSVQLTFEKAGEVSVLAEVRNP